MTKEPATIRYASVLSRKTVIIALMIAVLNDLKIKLGDLNRKCLNHFGS